MKKRAQLEHLGSPIVALRALFSEIKVPNIFIGGVAVSLLGTPRFTADVDLIIDSSNVDLRKLITTCKKYRIEPRIKNALEFARKNRVLLMVHKPSRIDIDVSLGILPFEIDSIKNSKRKMVSGVYINLPRLEDLIILKAVSHRLKDMNDIQNLLEIHPKMNKSYVLKIVRDFSKVLETPEILEDLKKIISG